MIRYSVMLFCRYYRTTNSAILGAILAIIFIALVILAVLIGKVHIYQTIITISEKYHVPEVYHYINFISIILGKYMNRHKGEYLTREDEGAQDAFDADTAVLQGRTGHQVEKKKEWLL